MVFGCEPVFLKKNGWMCGLFGIGILLRLGVGVSVVQLEGYLYHSIASREMLGLEASVVVMLNSFSNKPETIGM
jgi:hypothetical protein